MKQQVERVDDAKLELYRLRQMMDNAHPTDKLLAKDSSTHTFASEDEETAGRNTIKIKDYNGDSAFEGAPRGSRLPLIGGSQNLNNTTPARMNNVLNREGFEYSDGLSRNVSPARRIGAGLRDIMGSDAVGDRTNKVAAQQAAYAAALQEQINEKKQNPGGSKLGKNEEYRWDDGAQGTESAVPYHASPLPPNCAIHLMTMAQTLLTTY